MAVLGFLCFAAQAYAASPVSTTYQIDPAHDGAIAFSTAFGPPLKVHWSVELGGAVSYPVMADNLVVVLAGGKIGTHIAALNAATGKIVWQKLISGDLAQFHLASSDGGIIFLASDSYPLQAFRAANGQTLWSASVAGGDTSDVVPVAANGSVYIGGDYEGYRITGKTGFIDWWHQFNLASGTAVLGDSKLFLANSCDVSALAPASGRKLWEYNGNCENYGNLPSVYYQGRLYVGGAKVSETGLVLNATSGKLLGALTGYPPAFLANAGYAMSQGAIIATYLSSGNIKWVFQPTDKVSNPPIIVNSHVYSLSNAGSLYVNRAADGHLAQTLKLGLGTETALAPAPATGLGAGEGLIFVPNGSRLTAIGK